MDLNFTPLKEDLQKKIVGISLRKDEPKVAILLEGESIFFIDTKKGHILLPKKEEVVDGGRQLDAVGEGDVPEKLLPNASIE